MFPLIVVHWLSFVVEAIFEVISDCQQLYPDSDLSSDSADADEYTPEDYFTTADGLQHLSLEGKAVLTHLESIFVEDQDCNRDLG